MKKIFAILAALGGHYFSIYSRERAGLGVMSRAALRKAGDYLNKL